MDTCLKENFLIINDSPIELSNMTIDSETIRNAIVNTNKTINKIIVSTENMSFNLFDAIDFRNLSGVIGELFANELVLLNNKLCRNPHFHGYPDIIQVSTQEMHQYVNGASVYEFINYKFGGIEVKNTFGTKKTGSELFKGDTRILDINSKLDWKAHHRKTNYLLAIMSDFIDGIPTVVAAFFSADLNEEDWNKKQEPKEGSAMTSFTAISNQGYKKMLKGLKVCIDDERYTSFFK